MTSVAGLIGQLAVTFGSTAAAALPPFRPLWEPSPSHPILL